MARAAKLNEPASGESYEQRVAAIFERLGYDVEWPAESEPHCDFAATKGNARCAVRAKDLKGKAELNAMRAFSEFMDSGPGRRFRIGYFVTPKGLTKSAALYIQENPQARLRHLTSRGDNLHQVAGTSDVRPMHVGVFTFKGGVGKTKVALLLGCALAHRGHNTILVDLNRAQNLYNLVGEDGIYLRNERGPESVVSVFGRQEWNVTRNRWKVGEVLDARFVIYDCPQFFEKPAERKLLQAFDLVLSPIQLTIDSIGVDHAVLHETVAEVRRYNEHGPIEFLLNALRKEQWAGPLKPHLLAARSVFEADPRVGLLKPDKYLIPFSPHLEQLGADRALNPADHIEILFSDKGRKRFPWIDWVLRLADHVVQLAR